MISIPPPLPKLADFGVVSPPLKPNTKVLNTALGRIYCHSDFPKDCMVMVGDTNTVEMRRTPEGWESRVIDNRDPRMPSYILAARARVAEIERAYALIQEVES